jgi:enolase
VNITHIRARTILDSRGNPTVEAEVHCEGGVSGRAAVPSGASTGAHEAHELRDGGAAFGGRGVTQAISNITGEISAALRGVSADDQYRIDETLTTLDGTENKSRLGANAILAVSLAAAHAAANVRGLPLFRHINDIAHNPPMSIPMPMLNLLNGGRHATEASDFQEYMIVPTGARSYREGMQIAAEIFAALKNVLERRGLPTTLGDEGGFAPPTLSNTQTLDLLLEAAHAAEHEPGVAVSFALDIAATELLVGGRYELPADNLSLSDTEMIGYLAHIATRYPVISIEDGLAEDAWEAWVSLTKKLESVQVVGDDFLVTNPNRLARAIQMNAGNAILIKPNQIGTLTETIRTIAAAKSAGWNTIVSHRSGETEDTTIAHLAVGTGAGQIKTGSVARGERTAKHNELIRIEEKFPELEFKNIAPAV